MCVEFVDIDIWIIHRSGVVNSWVWVLWSSQGVCSDTFGCIRLGDSSPRGLGSLSTYEVELISM